VRQTRRVSGGSIVPEEELQQAMLDQFRARLLEVEAVVCEKNGTDAQQLKLASAVWITEDSDVAECVQKLRVLIDQCTAAPVLSIPVAAVSEETSSDAESSDAEPVAALTFVDDDEDEDEDDEEGGMNDSRASFMTAHSRSPDQSSLLDISSAVAEIDDNTVNSSAVAVDEKLMLDDITNSSVVGAVKQKRVEEGIPIEQLLEIMADNYESLNQVMERCRQEAQRDSANEGGAAAHRNVVARQIRKYEAQEGPVAAAVYRQHGVRRGAVEAAIRGHQNDDRLRRKMNELKEEQAARFRACGIRISADN
jgi:hypothetical protein